MIYPWVRLRDNDRATCQFTLLTVHLYTFVYNIASAMSLFIAPICGLIVDYQAHRDC